MGIVEWHKYMWFSLRPTEHSKGPAQYLPWYFLFITLTTRSYSFASFLRTNERVSIHNLRFPLILLRTPT